MSFSAADQDANTAPRCVREFTIVPRATLLRRLITEASEDDYNLTRLLEECSISTNTAAAGER
jgi:hypothetical protein